MSVAEARLCSHIAEAGRRGDWQSAMRLWNRYSGSAVPVITAALHAAFRCGRYREARRIYDRLTQLRIEVVPLTLMVAMKIFGKLNNAEKVAEIWAKIEDKGWVDKLSCGARIDAAAYLGDMEGAAQVLDTMHSLNLTVSVYSYNSAIYACASSSPPSHAAAMFLFQTLVDNGLQPTVVTCTNLARAHMNAGIPKLRRVRSIMNEYGIKCDPIFLETYLAAVFYGRIARNAFTAKDAEKLFVVLPDLHEREEEAKIALTEFTKGNVKLTHLSQVIKEYVHSRCCRP